LLACLLAVVFHFISFSSSVLLVLADVAAPHIINNNNNQPKANCTRAFTAKIGKEEEEQKTHTHTQS